MPFKTMQRLLPACMLQAPLPGWHLNSIHMHSLPGR